MLQQKIVSRFLDGRVLKGMTSNFSPDRPRFHMQLDGSDERVEVSVSALKSVFFVKDLGGNPAYTDRTDVDRTGFGRRIEVTFADGETIVGHTQGYSPTRPGFFIFPADPESNNDRIFVVRSATERIRLL